MSAESDPGLWAKIADWLWAVVLATGGWGWQHTHKRIAKVETLAESKTSELEHNRTKDNVAKIFDKIDEMKDSVNTRFAHMEQRNADQHTSLLHAINQRNGHD